MQIPTDFTAKISNKTSSLIRQYKTIVHKRRLGRIFPVSLNTSVGLGANLTWCLEILMHCDENNLIPCLMLTGRNYVSESMGHNWFEYFFKNLQISSAEEKEIEKNNLAIRQARTIKELGLPDNYNQRLSIKQASLLTGKYLGIRKELKKEVDLFYDFHLKNKTVLGIHYRGTDKSDESPRVSWEKVERNILKYLTEFPQTNCLFISSDEQGFIDFIKGKITDIAIVVHEDKYRAAEGLAIHQRFEGNNYLKGKEALINCLLLSKCNALMKTPSILSAWSKIFNPTIPIIMLSCPPEKYLWFPESEIVKLNELAFEVVE